MGVSFLDDCFKKIKNLCGGDETCILLVLLVVGFLLCYLFQTEGFGAGYGYDGSCDANSNTGCGARPANAMNVKNNANKAKNNANKAKNNAKNNSKNNSNAKNNAMVGLSPKPNRANAPSSMAFQMNSLGSVIQSDFGGNANGSINEVPVGIPARYLGAPIDMVFKNAKPLPNSQSGILNANGKANGMANGRANANGKANGKANIIANGNGTNSFGKQTGQNGASYNITFYYAPWCGHCKKMMPDFDDFDKEYGQGNAKINGKNVNVQKFNSDVDKEEIKKAGVRGFPDIRLNGNKLNVKNRTKDGIVEAIKNSNA